MTFEDLSKAVAFGADSVTVIVAAATLVAYIKNRKKLRLIFKVLVSAFFHDKISRINETLRKIEATDFKEKDQKAEVINLLGQLAGQMKNLVAQDQELKAAYDRIGEYLKQPKTLSEARKRELVHEIRGSLESFSLGDAHELLEHL